MRLLGFAGCKRAGKDSAARLVMGHVLLGANVIEKFAINDNGELLVNSAYRDANGKIVEEMGLFDTTRVDPAFQFYMEEKIFPHVKLYAFADTLKWICINVYGLEFEQLYGTGPQKQSPSKYKWDDILELLPKSIRPKANKEDIMSAREFVQNIGDVLRWVDDRCFIKSLLQRVVVEECPFGIITDVRTVDEVQAIKDIGGRVIYLTRELTNGDAHRTEHGFDGVDKTIFDAVIDNRTCSIQEKNDLVYKVIKEWGWL